MKKKENRYREWYGTWYQAGSPNGTPSPKKLGERTTLISVAGLTTVRGLSAAASSVLRCGLLESQSGQEIVGK
jgi:hypothetical protein